MGADPVRGGRAQGEASAASVQPLFCCCTSTPLPPRPWHPRAAPADSSAPGKPLLMTRCTSSNLGTVVGFMPSSNELLLI